MVRNRRGGSGETRMRGFSESARRSVVDAPVPSVAPAVRPLAAAGDACHSGRHDRPVQRLRLHRPRRAGLRRAHRGRRRARPARRRRSATLTYAEACELGRAGRRPSSTSSASEVGDRVAVVSHNSARLLTSFFGVCRLGPGAGAGQLPAAAGRGRATSSSTPARGCCYVDPELDDSLKDVDAEHTLRARRGRATCTPSPASSRGPGSPTRTPPRRSTTPPARPRGPRACRSPTATSGPTRSPSACTPASPTATSTSTRCRCSTPTAGGCRSR